MTREQVRAFVALGSLIGPDTPTMSKALEPETCGSLVFLLFFLFDRQRGNL